jgi:hypothetical protein
MEVGYKVTRLRNSIYILAELAADTNDTCKFDDRMQQMRPNPQHKSIGTGDSKLPGNRAPKYNRHSSARCRQKPTSTYDFSLASQSYQYPLQVVP